MSVKFPIKQIVMTQAASQLLVKHKKLAPDYVLKHRNLEQGSLCEQDHALNLEAVDLGNRIFSQYHLVPEDDTTRIWIITEADRSVTTILLPEEY